MEVISLSKEPSQIVKTILGNQQVQILLQQKRQGLLVDVNMNGVDIVTGVIALNETPMVCREYIGFPGNLFFVDLEGKSDPTYDKLGERFNLVYFEQDEYDLVRQ